MRWSRYALGLAVAGNLALIASLFLPNEYTKYTWLLPAFCTALYRVNVQELARK